MVFEAVKEEREKIIESAERNDTEEISVKTDWRNKRTRRLRGRTKLRKLYRQTKNKCCAGAWFDDEKNLLRKYSCNSKSLRQSCNRRFRRRMNRNLEVIPDGNGYRRYIDYWWILL